ncbi:hypothetical protein [Bosea lathyri]|uniref:Uncharacterized protein n=1 Tax=Bosea lathyri TaxID=1036778 RepID=A0A1H5W875_9HYPH|nr:hypothetical protein [Bosea lathyri]SEF95664.1 hypothetical protein SAMN04488115_102592 [Bosea lathyri]
MSKKTLPVPPANRTDKGPGGDKTAHVTQAADQQTQNLEQKGRHANIKQNTTHQGLQQDR